MDIGCDGNDRSSVQALRRVSSPFTLYRIRPLSNRWSSTLSAVEGSGVAHRSRPPDYGERGALRPSLRSCLARQADKLRRGTDRVAPCGDGDLRCGAECADQETAKGGPLQRRRQLLPVPVSPSRRWDRIEHPEAQGVPFSWAFAGAIVAALVVSAVSFRWIEAPSQRLGRALLARTTALWAPET